MQTFRLSEAEFLEAQRLFSRLTGRKLARLVVATGIGGLIMVPILKVEWQMAPMVAIGGAVGGMLASLSLDRIYLPWRARKLFRQQKGLQELFHFAWDESGVYYESPLGNSKTPWEHYREVRESASVFILLLSDNMFHIVPKHALGGPDGMVSFRLACSRVRI